MNESIPPSVPRDAMHTRRVEVNGYRRHDDLYDIEGTLIDVKSQDFENILGLEVFFLYRCNPLKYNFSWIRYTL